MEEASEILSTLAFPNVKFLMITNNLPFVIFVFFDKGCKY